MQPVFDFLDDVGDNPFFVWFAPTLPHVPHSAPSEFLSIYENAGLSASAVAYYASCSWFDRRVGEILAALEARGLRENTLVLFVTDNGWEQAPHRDRTDYHLGGMMGGPKGKASMHELGFRTPVIASWPGRLPEGKVVDELVSLLDVVPTILDYTGIAIPASMPGHSLRPLVEDPPRPIRAALIAESDSIRPAPPGPRAELPLERAARARETFWAPVLRRTRPTFVPRSGATSTTSTQASRSSTTSATTPTRRPACPRRIPTSWPGSEPA